MTKLGFLDLSTSKLINKILKYIYKKTYHDVFKNIFVFNNSTMYRQ